MDNQKNFSIYKNKLTAFFAGILLIFTISISFMFTSFAGQSGDIDGNNTITASDARAILRHSAQLEILDDNILEFADVDFNGIITASDARIVLRVAAQLQDFDIPEQKTENNTEKVTTDIETTTEIESTTAETTTEHTHNYLLTASVFGSCTSTGLNTYTCDGCNDTYTETIPMTYHSTPYGKCEFCSQKINDVQIQLALAEHDYETDLEYLGASHEANIEDIEREINAAMETAGVTVLYSSDYYKKQISYLDDEIAQLYYKLISAHSSSYESYKRMYDQKVSEQSKMKLLLDAALLQESLSGKDTSYSVEKEKYKADYLEKIENIKGNSDAIKCMCCLEVMKENSTDGFCDKCRILLDEKTVKIAAENTRYYNSLIELYIEYLINIEGIENLDAIDADTKFLLQNILGVRSWEELVEFLNSNQTWLKMIANQMGMTEDEFKQLINPNFYKEGYAEDLDRKITELETEHLSILDSIEKKYS